MDGRAATATTGGGEFRFDDVGAGTYTIISSNYPGDARFDRTSAITGIDSEGRAAAGNSHSYVRGSRSTRPVLMADDDGTGRHSTLLASRAAFQRTAIET